MRKERRPRINKKVFVAVCLITLACLISGSALALWSTREIRNIVVERFNEEQLLVSRNISRSVRQGLNEIERELRLLRGEISASTPSDRDVMDSIQHSLVRLRASGVWKIGLVDIQNRQEISCSTSLSADITDSLPNCAVRTTPTDGAGRSDKLLPSIEQINHGNLWISGPKANAGGVDLLLIAPLDRPPHRALAAHLNVFQFLKPLLSGIRSGETGYAWMIDENGVFLFHPDAYFVGKNAFDAREKRDPTISYRQINAIQEKKMVRGEEGTGWYFSGWHREELGKVKKLFAFTPVVVSRDPAQTWSVAVCAPFAEIEKAFHSGGLRLLLAESFIFIVVILGAAAVLFFEVRWSRTLEEKVYRRTEELRKSEERYRSLVESAEDFIFTLDSGGYFQSMNNFTASFFGGHPAQFVGQPMADLFSEEVAAKELKLVNLVFRSGKSVRDEFAIRTGDRETTLNANFMPLKNEAGQVLSVLCIARDITESKKLEKQLINTEKLASMGTLAAGVAHEINNPLGVILGFCDLLMEKAEPSSRDYQDLKMIEKQGLLCKQVVENLLSFARQQGGELLSCDLTDCLQQIVQIVQHTLEMNDIELHLDFAEDVPPVKGDSRQLQQVFLNLINNAMAAMKEGGELMIRTKWDHPNGKVIVELQDSGVGIDDVVMDRIFEPFFTTKPEGEGTGLGLFVSYGIITKYGGSISCSSRTAASPDRAHGTTFIVKLPAAKVETCAEIS